MRLKNLLIISNRFPHSSDEISNIFVKNQVDALAPFFNHIYVLALTPYVPKFLARYASRRASRWARDVYAKNYSYDNIDVHFLKEISFPFDFSRRKRGDKCFYECKMIIDQNEFEFDLIHAHFIWPSGFVGMRLKREYNKPLVITAHGHDIYEIPNWSDWWRNSIRRILNASDIVITVSKKNQSLIKDIGMNMRRVVVIPNGYQHSTFKPISNLKRELVLPNIDPSSKTILTIGNLIPIKGHSYLVDALAKIKRKKISFKCIIIGEGPEQLRIERKIRLLGLQKDVTIVEFRPHAEIPLWMNACDLFVLPSLVEGNPTVLFEALGCGKPFVGTKVGGIPEIINDERLGILVDPADSDALGEALLTALNREWNNGYISDYSKQFTWKEIAKKIGASYDSALIMKANE